MIFLIFLFFLLLSLKAEGERISVIGNGHLLKTETKDYFEEGEGNATIALNARNRPATPFYPQNAYTDITNEIQAVFGADSEIALKVAVCESNLNPNAVNWGDAQITGMPSMGVFQINAPYDEKYFDYKYNIQVAYEMFLRRGWQPWSCFTKGLI